MGFVSGTIRYAKPVSETCTYCKLYWEHGLLPETFQIELEFYMSLKPEAKGKYESCQDFKNFVAQYFDTDRLNQIVKNMPTDGSFKPRFVVYSHDRELKSIHSLYYRKNGKCIFGFYVIMEADNESKAVSISEVSEEAQKFCDNFEKYFFHNRDIVSHFNFIKYKRENCQKQTVNYQV